MMPSTLDAWIAGEISPLNRRTLERAQLQALNALLCRAKACSRRYADYPDALPFLQALETLPFTSACDLFSADLLLVSQSRVRQVMSERTSGTQGQAKRIHYTREDIQRTIEFFAHGLSQLIRRGDRTLILMPCAHEHSLGRRIAAALTQLGAQPLLCDERSPFCEMLRLARLANTAVSPPILLLSLARYAAARGTPLSLRSALVSADVCTPHISREIRRQTGCELFQHYGSREIGLGGAVECAAHRGMHVRENDLLVEIVDKNGHPLPDGRWGELVITTLRAQAMPLIRYRTGDRGRILPTPCSCGSILRRIDGISRLQSRGVPMQALDDIAFSHPAILDQRVQNEGDGLALHLVALQRVELPALRRAYAAALPPGLPFSLHVHLYNPQNERAQYSRKRRVLRDGEEP